MKKFLKLSLIVFLIHIILLNFNSCQKTMQTNKRTFNGPYTSEYLNRIAFPIGGIGAGMFCLEGTGALSHFSLRHNPQVFNEPLTFSTLTIKGEKNIAKVLEGPVPSWKIFGAPGTGNGAGGTSYGLPHFDNASFLTRFPFGTITLQDAEIPLQVAVNSWSPFIPGDADNSSLPVGALEFTFKNPTNSAIEALYTFNARNFMKIEIPSEWGGQFHPGDSIASIRNGFILSQAGTPDAPHYQGDCAVFVDDNNAVIDHCWFRGGWWDAVTILWKHIQEMQPRSTPVQSGSVSGASIFVPFQLKPGESRTIRLMFAWYVPCSDLRTGPTLADEKECPPGSSCSCGSKYYSPWYTSRFKAIHDVAEYWRMNYPELQKKSALFRDTFYESTLPPEVLEAVAANLTILKSPTVMRQKDGKLWCWEGCHDQSGCCHGSCTHVWNYAQAICHLFPALERSLRETEYFVSQDTAGHQNFRSSLPIRPTDHKFHAATDGQLGGIMKVYREWRISGDTNWLKKYWPKVKESMNYCIQTWDPAEKGIIEEPHHNTYDIEFWGPDPLCTSFYLGALSAFIKMSTEMGEDATRYGSLLEKGKKFLENDLYNGEYFYQRIKWEGLKAPNPVEASAISFGGSYSPEALEILQKEGPKYQYGAGCLSDGVLGFWIAQMCGLGEIGDVTKVKNHLKAVHQYNLKKDLTDHVNPQRPAYAMGKEGGLLLCTWPQGGELSLPFVYSNEVWTGIEYQVASHLMLEGLVKEGLDIVRTCRARYDGRIRNPFNEYECGHWYARAMSSYGLLEGLTGVRYDAVEKALYIDSKVGNDFKTFLATETGFGQVGLRAGKPFVEMKMGDLDVEKIFVSGKEVK
ncbi:hypothetical protein JW964_08035 [candidate division KSB1 bacterium]|nr:hypothetical protein [candidate division KSB1 bacterium]